MTDMQSILSLIQSQSYLLIFILMIVEGPVTTVAAAFASSLGIFNIYIIIILSTLGNLIPDTLLYFIGRFSRGPKVERYLIKLGFKKNRIEQIDSGFKKHAGKTLVFAKLTPTLPVLGLILSGFTKVPIKKFFLIDILFNITSAIIFVGIGFYFGVVSASILKYLKIREYVLLFIIPLAVLVYFLYKKISKKIAEKEKI